MSYPLAEWPDPSQGNANPLDPGTQARRAPSFDRRARGEWAFGRSWISCCRRSPTAWHRSRWSCSPKPPDQSQGGSRRWTEIFQAGLW